MLCGAALPDGGFDPPAIAPGSGELLLLPRAASPPAPGTLAIAVFHDTETIIAHYHTVATDFTSIGREDASRGIFPDLDLSQFQHNGVDGGQVSRCHARLVRRGDTLSLDVLEGTTGTQVNRNIVAPGTRVAVEPGTRIILAGHTRLKIVQL